MPHLKRKRSADHGVSSGAASSSEHDSTDDEIDIFSSLVGDKSGVGRQEGKYDNDNDIEDLQDMIRESIAKRDVKSGTEVLKKSKGKGKAKMAKGEVGGGSFQSMGLHPSLLRSLTLQGYRIPTPIQRLAVPALLSTPPRDLVGMARTGSGKTLAYMIPLVQRLSGRHATAFGARALILLPARELALQVMKVGKELARGWVGDGGDHAGDAEHTEDTKKGQSLRWGLVVGGEGLDEQFEMITSNPDVIIATPGRLLHLVVEMNLDLRSVQYVVFDEADRLFEMGFATALNEILHRLPTSRQTLLFSATLPKSLVDFAKAGLQNPKLVRLDAESKISTDLRMAFFSVKHIEKDACLLVLLRDVIGVPFGSNQPQDQSVDGESKGKFKGKDREVRTAPHQTLIFTATKHHVEYITNLLTTAGYAVSHIYGALDQTARSLQMEQFRRGVTSILVVTDVAARGIDIPVLENVVNYDFPQGARVFVHRVGRTARAGRKGWAWSFVTHPELPHLLDLQLFLARPIKSQVTASGDQEYTESLVLGHFDRDRVDAEVEYIRTLDEVNHALTSMRDVMRKGQSMYERSQGKASQASYKRAKEMVKDGKWGLAGVAGEQAGVHPILLRGKGNGNAKGSASTDREDAKNALLKAVNSFKPAETVFEIGSRGKTAGAALMKDRRKALSKAVERAALASSSATAIDESHPEDDNGEVLEVVEEMEMADEDDLAAVFDMSKKKQGKSRKDAYRDEEFYMSHYQKDAMTEKGYSLKDGNSFTEQVRNATFDLVGDEGAAARQRRNSQMTWDKKKKKFIKGDGAGADNVKIVKTESGTRLPASYRSGRFDEWKAKSRVSLPKVGEAEPEGARGQRPFSVGGRKFIHQKITPAKPLDKFSTGYERKVRQFKKKGAASGESEGADASSSRSLKGGKMGAGAKSGGRYGGKPIGRVRSELKSADQIRKSRAAVERKRAKNARPSRKKGKR